MARLAGARVDHYVLVEHLADGAQAEVWRGRDERGADVVLKFPHLRTLEDPTLVARWRREVRLTEGLSHPGLQCRCDVGERHLEPYTVCDYASGGSLRGWVSVDSEPLPVGQVIAWGRQLAEALAYLHYVGVVHRDLKPENVLVTEELTLKLGDFGSAVHLVNESRWRSWLGLRDPAEGTADYLSPEQILGRRGDERTDVYGWGVLMYELLTGRRPFEGADDLAVMAAHLSNQPVPIRELRSDVPPALEAVVATAMRRRREERFPSAVVLLDALDHLDELNEVPARVDPPLLGTVALGEGVALLRLAAVVAAGFLSIVTFAVTATIALR